MLCVIQVKQFAVVGRVVVPWFVLELGNVFVLHTHILVLELLVKVGCMRRRWLAVVSCSLIATGMYTRSFCEFLEEPHYTATVIHYHQWKINNFISQRTKLRFFTDLISFSLRTCPVESANAQDDFIAEMTFFDFSRYSGYIWWRNL